MAGWVKAAEGTNLWDLRSALEDVELQKGDRIRVTMQLNAPVGWMFNVAGAELAFKPFVPPGVDLRDVSGEGNVAYVDMEADPVWLLAALAFIQDNWLAIAISGILLTALVISIIVEIKVAQAPPQLVAPLAIAAAATVGIVALIRYAPKRSP